VNEDDDLNIDASSFDVDKYVGTLLQYKSLEELVQRGNAMVSEIKSLDSDMQMLVYENYNKFISATDTIRKMKHRVEEMEFQMVELEQNMGTISTASESVDSSLSARRGQLEKLNGAKKNLTKLQFLMDLPSRLQRCVREEQYEVAVDDFRKARRILRAVGNVASFQGIEDEATLIIKRLSQVLSARLQQPALPPEALGSTTKLLLQLEGNESVLLKEYLNRRRRALHEMLTSFPPSTTMADAVEGEDETSAPAGTSDENTPVEEEDLLPAAVSDVARMGAAFVPELVELHLEWQKLFSMETPEPVLAETSSVACSSVNLDAKENMILDALQELTGSYIEVCRRRLQEDTVDPEQLLQGIRKLVGALEDMHTLVPQAKLMQRATRAAETLAKRAMDIQLQLLQERLASLVSQASGAEFGAALQEQLNAMGNAIAENVRDALSSTAPLIVPLCELLGLRADGMAKHLVARLYASLSSLSTAALEPTSGVGTVLARAGICLHMVATGVTQVPAMLKAQLAPHGLGGAALGFDSASMTREMQASADGLLERFVEMQAQKLSLDVSKRMQSANWLKCPPPHEVTLLVDHMLRELRSMQSLAVQVLPGEPVRSMLPQGPFASARSTTAAIVQQRSNQQQPATSTAIHKDLERMFARKISFSTNLGAAGSKSSVTSMLNHVTKLTLKTLVEEIRFGTFSREGFQQLQLDCAFLRWALPSNVEDEGAVLALLDEAIISCQERCLDPAMLEHSAMEPICEAKRKECVYQK